MNTTSKQGQWDKYWWLLCEEYPEESVMKGDMLDTKSKVSQFCYFYLLLCLYHVFDPEDAILILSLPDICLFSKIILVFTLSIFNFVAKAELKEMLKIVT